MKHLTIAGVVLTVVAVVLAMSAVANAAVPHYTGCLTDKGVFIGFQAGETPLIPCGGDKVTQAQLSAGDITKIDAGTGLTGGGVNGDVALDVAPTYRLPQSCATDQIAKWSGATWLCANDSNTTYSGSDFALSNQSCSSGKLVSGVSSTGTLNCANDQNTTYSGSDFALSNQACASGKVANAVGGAGALACVDDQNTTYSGANFALSNQTCPSGEFAKGVSVTGSLSCDTPASSAAALATFEATAGPPCCGVAVNKSADGANPLVSVNLPAGSYLIIARGIFENQNGAIVGDNSRSVACTLEANGQQDIVFFRVGGSFFHTEGSVQGFATFSAAGTASMNCSVAEDPSHMAAYRLKIDALKVG